MKKRKKIVLLILSLFFVCSNLFSQSISYPDSSVLAHGDWYKFSIPSSGLYKLTYTDFIALGIPAEKIVSKNLSIYGNGGHQISPNNSLCTSSDLKENSIYVYDPNNNFSQGGYVVFYGEGGTEWNFDKYNKTWSFNLHPYSDKSYYFVTFSDSIGEKKRVNSISNQSLLADISINCSRDCFLSKQELNNIESSGRLWVGKQFISNMTEEYPLDLKNALVDENNNLLRPATLEYKLVAKSSTNTNFITNFNNQIIDTIVFQGWTSTTTGDVPNDKVIKRNIYSIKPISNKVNITFTGGSLSKGWIDYIFVNYDKKLDYSYPAILKYKTTEYLEQNKIIENVITNVPNENIVVWDVTNWTNPIQVIGNYNSTNKTYSFNLNSDTLRTITAFHNNSNFNTVTPIGKIENQNLHASEAVDYVIITNPIFLEQANRLAKIHQDYDNMTTKVVTIDQIYNEFSSGNPDFLAYKEYLRMLYNKYINEGKNPKNVLLFGDGTFDNKNILKYNNNFILTYQSDNTFQNQSSSPCEDYIAFLSPNAKGLNIPQSDSLLIGVGRFPANNIEEAENLVNKSERYLLKKDIIEDKTIGDWRNVAVLTADDPDDGERYFIEHAEHIYDQEKLQQPQLNANKIYSDAYKQYASSAGNTYPDASKAINQQMKKGCLIFNYVGHGSEDHLSSERLITITDIMGWNNYNSMPLLITSTCEFARFDMVDKPSAAEYTLYNKNGGMIALISASRTISSEDLINQDFHRFILEKTENNQTRTFGQAYAAAKNNKTNGLGFDKRCVLLLGDPALRISTPKYNVVTTSINDIDPEIENDTLKALSTATIKGKIVDNENNIVENFNGVIQLTLFDKSSNYYTLDNENNGSAIQFEQQKNILYKGKAKVENGIFTHSFTIPKDIAYNYGYGKLSYYAQTDSVDAGGYCNNFVIGGIDNSVEIEETRPLVRLFINDSNFRSGGITDENPKLYSIISDKIAINTVGSGLGHDITATLDNAANTFILNDYFEQDSENPYKGYISFNLSSLTEGEHTLTLKAWNIFNFSSSETIKFNVISKGEETYANLKNFPNPFQSKTNFYLEHNQNEKIKSAEIQIFNTAGMMVKTIKLNNPSNGYSIGPIEWDGTTDGGQKLQKGIYIYRMLLNKEDDKHYTTAQKLVIF